MSVDSARSASRDTRVVFRTPARYWLLAFASLAAALVAWVWSLEATWPGRGAPLGIAVWLIIAGITTQLQLLPMTRTTITVDSRGIEGRMDRYNFEVYWPEVVAANLFHDELHRSSRLWIAARKRVYNVSLRYLDARRVYGAIQEHLDPSAVGLVGLHNYLDTVPLHRKIAEASQALLRGVQGPVRTRQKWTMILFGAWGVTLYVSSTVLAIRAMSAWWLPTVLFAAAALYSLLLFPDTIEMDDKKVGRSHPLFGRYEMQWDEIERIELGRGNEWLVFYGKDKRLPMWGPRRWAKKGSREVFLFLLAQAQLRKIQIELIRVAPVIIFARNTRVR